MGGMAQRQRTAVMSTACPVAIGGGHIGSTVLVTN